MDRSQFIFNLVIVLLIGIIIFILVLYLQHYNSLGAQCMADPLGYYENVTGKAVYTVTSFSSG